MGNDVLDQSVLGAISFWKCCRWRLHLGRKKLMLSRVAGGTY